MVGNICAALSPNYWMLLISRFISGLPHGAYFGVGSIVAERLADKGKSSEAVSIMIAGMTIREDRLENFDFSDGYFEDGSIMAVAADSSVSSLEDLRGKTVAAKKGTVSTDYAVSIKDEYGFEITYFEDSPTMYQAVITGTAVACFEDYSVIGWAIKNGDVAMRTVGDVVNPGQYGFAVKKNTNAELIEKFNKGLANLKSSGKYDEILEKYGY